MRRSRFQTQRRQAILLTNSVEIVPFRVAIGDEFCDEREPVARAPDAGQPQPTSPSAIRCPSIKRFFLDHSDGEPGQVVIVGAVHVRAWKSRSRQPSK